MIEGKVQEIWEEFGRVKDTMEKVEKNRGRERGRKNGGQHEECRRKKREIRRGLKVWRKSWKRDRSIGGKRGNIKNYVREKDKRKMKDGRGKQRKQEWRDKCGE